MLSSFLHGSTLPISLILQGTSSPAKHTLFALPSGMGPLASQSSWGEEGQGSLRKDSQGTEERGWREPGRWTQFSKRHKRKGSVSWASEGDGGQTCGLGRIYSELGTLAPRSHCPQPRSRATGGTAFSAEGPPAASVTQMR